MTMTETQVREAAKQYNTEYPEAAADIDAGQRELHVRYFTEGTGWRITVTAAETIRSLDGGSIYAEDPQLLADGQRLPRWAANDMAKFIGWLVRKAYPGHPNVVIKRAGK